MPDEIVIVNLEPPVVVEVSNTVVTLQTGGAGSSGPPGPEGPTGPTGATGATGPTGATGTNGINGTNGTNGLDGTDGTDGATGPQGPSGANGSNGLDGSTGATGPQGVAGTNGADGVNGATGPAGADGTDGAQGIQGLTGATGPTGPQGSQGIQGFTGPAGTDGLNGATGATGPQGIAGSDGTNGPQGIQGLTGNTGPTGPQGVQGATGSAGLIQDIGYTSGQFYGAASTTSGTFLSAYSNQTFYLPFYIGSSTTFNSIACRTLSSFVGTVNGRVRLGIYNNSTVGKPSTVFLDAGTVLLSTNNTTYQISISVTLTQGWYWLAFNCQTQASTNHYLGATILLSPRNSLDSSLNATNVYTQNVNVSTGFATAGTISRAASAPTVGLLKT